MKKFLLIWAAVIGLFAAAIVLAFLVIVVINFLFSWWIPAGVVFVVLGVTGIFASVGYMLDSTM